MPELLIDLGWKSALIAGVALAASHALKSRAPAERVMLLRVALAALLALPLCALLLPALEIAILPAPEAVAAADPAIAYAENMAVADSAPGLSLQHVLLMLYGLGAAIVVARLGMGLLTLRRWTRAASPVSEPGWKDAAARASARLRRPVRLMVSPHVSTPMSWGVAPAWVLIDPTLERRADQAEAVIAHEMAHVRHFDWPVLLASQAATAMFWFNPLVWLVDRELARQIELAADEEAIGHVARADYAQALLAAAGSPVRHACGMAGGHMLARRISRVLDGAAQRPVSRLLCAALIAAGPALAVPLAAAKIVPVQDAVKREPVQPLDAPARGPAPVRVSAQDAPSKAAPVASQRKPVPRGAAERVRKPARSAVEQLARTEALPVVATGPVPAKPRPVPAPPKFDPVHGPHAPPPGRTDEVRDYAQAQAQRAVIRDLYSAAESLEKKAQDLNQPRELRQAHMAAASTYRRQAGNFERRLRQPKP